MDHDKIKILLIDDDVIQHQIVENMLSAEYEVIKVKSGNDALSYLYNGSFIPNLILLDILMPEMDGWEVFTRVRAVSILKNVPIIFVTAVNTSAEEKKAFDLGAADFLRKPYNKDDLISRVNKAIGV